MQDPAISITDLHVSYYGNEAIKGVSLSVDTGNLVGDYRTKWCGKINLFESYVKPYPYRQRRSKNVWK